MRKHIFLAALSAALLIVSVSCSKSGNQTSTDSSAKPTAVKAKVQTAPAVVVYDSCSLWNKVDEGMEYSQTVRQGTILQVVVSENNPVSEEALRLSDKQTRTFYKIIFDNEVRYVQDAVVAFNAIPAAIDGRTESVFTYNSADDTDFSKLKISSVNFCAVYNEFVDANFACVKLLTADEKLYNKLYVKKSDVVTDTEAVMYLQTTLLKPKGELLAATIKTCLDDMQNFVSDSRSLTEKPMGSKQNGQMIVLQDDGKNANGSLWVKSKDDPNVLVWKKYIPAGTVVTNCSSKTSTYDRLSDGKTTKVDFYSAKFKDDEGFVQADRVAPYNGKEGFMMEDAVVFSAPNPLDYTKKIAKKDSIVLVTGTAERSYSLGFYKVIYFDASTYTVKEGYVRDYTVSADTKDTKALLTARKAKTEEDADIRTKLLENALSSATTTYTRNLISEMLGIEPEKDEELTVDQIMALEESFVSENYEEYASDYESDEDYDGDF